MREMRSTGSTPRSSCACWLDVSCTEIAYFLSISEMCIVCVCVAGDVRGR